MRIASPDVRIYGAELETAAIRRQGEELAGPPSRALLTQMLRERRWVCKCRAKFLPRRTVRNGSSRDADGARRAAGGAARAASRSATWPRSADRMLHAASEPALATRRAAARTLCA